MIYKVSQLILQTKLETAINVATLTVAVKFDDTGDFAAYERRERMYWIERFEGDLLFDDRFVYHSMRHPGPPIFLVAKPKR